MALGNFDVQLLLASQFRSVGSLYQPRQVPADVQKGKIRTIISQEWMLPLIASRALLSTQQISSGELTSETRSRHRHQRLMAPDADFQPTREI